MTIMNGDSIPSEVDIIVAGGTIFITALIIGGAAGCVLAGRLAKADPSLQILIIEAGVNNLDNPLVTTPALYLAHLAPNSKTANCYTSKPSDQVGGRANVVVTGGLLGGGSSINFMMYTRANASDYDDWNTPAWTFNDLKPLLKKVPPVRNC
jgi:alcohol oxidase